MHFLVHRRGNLVEKIKEKFVGIEVHGFVSGSDCLEFIGMDCEAAMEFTKQRYNGLEREREMYFWLYACLPVCLSVFLLWL